MKILVDADACPVKQIIVSIARKMSVHVIMIADTSHVINDEYAEVIIVDKAKDSADMALINKSEENDIVVTQDYGVAAMALAKGAYAINQNGLIYNNENINQLLFERHLGSKMRRAGKAKGYHKKRSKENDVAFQISLEMLIKSAIKNI